MGKTLITDFDGTITERDFFAVLAERYIPGDAPDYFAEWRAGRMSHFEAMAAYFAYAPDDEAQMDAVLADCGVDPGLKQAYEKLTAAGWEVLVVSAGSAWYIERLLGRAGVAPKVYANSGRLEKGRGLVIAKLPADSPFYSEDVGVDKSAVVQDALGRSEEVAFAGDGPPDVLPAMLVSAERRFARGYLAEELNRRDERYHGYRRWSEIAEVLL